VVEEAEVTARKVAAGGRSRIGEGMGNGGPVPTTLRYDSPGVANRVRSSRRKVTTTRDSCRSRVRVSLRWLLLIYDLQ